MSARAWAAFAAISTLWGMPYLFIKVAVDDGVPPIVLAWVRVTIAAVILLALVGIDVAGDARELVGALGILLAAVGYAAGPMLLNKRLAPARSPGCC
jgi:drug/metabolite transporter (DMT)-like permease